MSTANFSAVPVVMVTRDNVSDVWPCLMFCLKNSVFVAVDLELSGLGNRKDLTSKSIEDRYRAMVEVARTRAIVSVGLSCFLESSSWEIGDETTRSKRYQVHTYNLMCLCSNEYTVEPDSLKFLVKHGFDFNKQYRSGLSYYRGSDKADEKENYLRQLFLKLLCVQRPLVLHNGFVDLVFLYEHFYSSLPSSLSAFLADVHQMFPEGVFDTKYLAEFKERLRASYLEYVFKYRQHENWKLSEARQPCVKLEFMASPLNFAVEFCYCELRPPPTSETVQVCKFFASHGWCSKEESCVESHNIDDILDAEILRRNKRKRKSVDVTTDADMKEDVETSPEQRSTTTDVKSVPETHCDRSTGSHRAGFDAFMNI